MDQDLTDPCSIYFYYHVLIRVINLVKSYRVGQP